MWAVLTGIPQKNALNRSSYRSCRGIWKAIHSQTKRFALPQPVTKQGAGGHPLLVKHLGQHSHRISLNALAVFFPHKAFGVDLADGLCA